MHSPFVIFSLTALLTRLVSARLVFPPHIPSSAHPSYTVFHENHAWFTEILLASTTTSATPTPTPSFNPKPHWDPCDSEPWSYKDLSYVRHPHDMAWVSEPAAKWSDCCRKCHHGMYNCMAARWKVWVHPLQRGVKAQFEELALGAVRFGRVDSEFPPTCELMINQVRMEGAATSERCSLGIESESGYNETRGKKNELRVGGEEVVRNGYISGPCWLAEGVVPFGAPVVPGVNLAAP